MLRRNAANAGACLVTVLVVCLLLPVHETAAQEAGPSRMIGLRMGLAASDFGGDAIEASDRSFRPGFDLAGICRIRVNTQLSIQAELSLVQKGVNWKHVDKVFGYTFDVDESVNLLYLDLPIALRMPLWNAPARSVGVFAGPYLSFNLRGTRTGDANIRHIPSPLRDDMLDHYSGPVGNLRTLGLGFVCGFDYAKNLSRGRCLIFDVRYCLGMSRAARDIDWDDAYDSDDVPLVHGSGEALDLHNGTFILSVGIGFPR